ncbi:MAG: helix-turn-helix domain-containing protein [Acidimicrobiia bacterium]
MRAGAVETSTLAGLRRLKGLTQVELAERLGMSQSDLSKLERRRDLRLSSLRSVVRALGGELELRASLPDGDLRLVWPDPVHHGAGEPDAD